FQRDYYRVPFEGLGPAWVYRRAEEAASTSTGCSTEGTGREGVPGAGLSPSAPGALWPGGPGRIAARVPGTSTPPPVRLQKRVALRADPRADVRRGGGGGHPQARGADRPRPGLDPGLADAER